MECLGLRVQQHWMCYWRSKSKRYIDQISVSWSLCNLNGLGLNAHYTYFQTCSTQYPRSGIWSLSPVWSHNEYRTNMFHTHLSWNIVSMESNECIKMNLVDISLSNIMLGNVFISNEHYLIRILAGSTFPLFGNDSSAWTPLIRCLNQHRGASNRLREIQVREREKYSNLLGEK